MDRRQKTGGRRHLAGLFPLASLPLSLEVSEAGIPWARRQEYGRKQGYKRRYKKRQEHKK